MVVQRWAKRKGTIAERDLIAKFWDVGWSAHRIAGSGSNKYPSPDLIVGTPLRKLAIEVKMISATTKYFSAEEIHGLLTFSQIFGSEPWVAVQFLKGPWYFFPVEDLRETKSAYVITQEDGERKGLLFEELTR